MSTTVNFPHWFTSDEVLVASGGEVTPDTSIDEFCDDLIDLDDVFEPRAVINDEWDLTSDDPFLADSCDCGFCKGAYDLGSFDPEPTPALAMDSEKLLAFLDELIEDAEYVEGFEVRDSGVRETLPVQESYTISHEQMTQLNDLVWDLSDYSVLLGSPKLDAIVDGLSEVGRSLTNTI